MRSKKRAQSVTEYAILLGVAIAVFAGMQTFVKRGFQAKIKTSTDAMTGAGANKTINVSESGDDDYGSLSMGKLSQYEPYYTYQKGDSYSESQSTDSQDGQNNLTKKTDDFSATTGSESGQRIGNQTELSEGGYSGQWK
jgi:hypothetical protein